MNELKLINNLKLMKRPQMTQATLKPNKPEGRPQTHHSYNRNAKFKLGRMLSTAKRSKETNSFARPPSSQVRIAALNMNQSNVSDKHWDIISKQNESNLEKQQVIEKRERPGTTCSLHKSTDPVRHVIQEKSKEGVKVFQAKPCDFLLKLGGNTAVTDYQLESEPLEIFKATVRRSFIKDCPWIQETNLFTRGTHKSLRGDRLGLAKPAQESIKENMKLRPKTAHLKSFKQRPNTRLSKRKSSISKKPTSGLNMMLRTGEEMKDNWRMNDEDYSVNNEQIDTSIRFRRFTAEDLLKTKPTVAHFNKKPEDDNEIYPPLFDRSERTRAVVFTKNGNSIYSKPTQRIGVYMDYTANLKRSQLMDIISYLKTTARKYFSVADKSTPLQYLNTSLFHGHMKEESEVLKEIYDPINKDAKELTEYKKLWTKELKNELKKSQKRYLHYIMREEIIADEIALYNKKWMEHILEKVQKELLKKSKENKIRELYQDIVDLFVLSMKRAIVNYILRSPIERKRLRINILPRTILPSSELITYKGGYNISTQIEWHDNKSQALEKIKANLLTNNIIMSALQNWFQDFRAIHLLYFKDLSPSKEPIISVANFFELEKRYRRKVEGLFRHIWYRGAILILYKFKYLKKSSWGTGLFTLCRYASLLATDHINVEYIYLDNIKNRSIIEQKLALEYTVESILDKDWSSLILKEEELEDIRNTDAYQKYIKLFEANIDYKEDSYKSLSKEFRSELKYAAGNLMRLQMREVIERTLELTSKYFKPFDTTKLIELDITSLKQIKKKSVNKKIDESKLRTEINKVLKQACSGTTKPIWRIEMKVDNDKVQITESEDYIILGIIGLIDKVCNTFNKFLHPDFARPKYLNKSQLEDVLQLQKNKEQMFVHLNDVKERKHMEQNIYQKYCGNIRITESKKQSKTLQAVFRSKSFFNKQIDKTFNIGEFMRNASSKPESKYANYKLHIQNTISKYYSEATQLLKVFSPFKWIINKQILVDYATFTEKEPIVLDEYREHIKEINVLIEIINEIPKVFFMTMFEVSCERVIKHMKDTLNEAKIILKDKMEDIYIIQCGEIIENYSNAVSILKTPMTSPNETQYIEAFKASLILDTVNWKEDAYKANKILFTLIDIDLIPSEEVMNITTELHFWPSKLRQVTEEVDEPHRVQREQQEKLLRQRRSTFEKEASQFAKKIPALETFREIKDCKKIMETISALEAEINTLKEQRRTINECEKMLFDFETSFDAFNKVDSEFRSYWELWKSVETFGKQSQHWFQSILSELDLKEMEEQLKDHIRVLRKSEKFFTKKTRPAGYGATQAFGKKVEEMKKVLPIIEILTNPGLKERHWEKAQSILEVRFDWRKVTMKNLISKGVEMHKEELLEISELAGKEYVIEKALEKMKAEWENQEFIIITKEDKGIKLLSGNRIEEMQLLLDEHIVTAQQIRANPFVVPMEEEASEWEKKLLNLREVLDKWTKIQLDYLYLHPIFDSEDITRHLPDEAEKFDNVNSIWQSLIESVASNKKAIDIDRFKVLIQNLDEAQTNLDSIAANLNNYLEDKRKKFPRLYFLANDDIYDILREARNPKKVVPYLKKLFEGIKDLVFAQNLDIIGMKSEEGEKMNFIRKIVPEEYHGSIENLLINVEREMRNSVAKEISRAIKGYTENRLDWLGKDWAGQAILAVSQLIWCQKITECISKKSLKDLISYLSICQSQLKDCVKLIRQSLPKLQQITISSLIVIDVHLNDILESLITNEVISETAFEWLSQLRYYYDSFSIVNNKVIYRN